MQECTFGAHFSSLALVLRCFSSSKTAFWGHLRAPESRDKQAQFLPFIWHLIGKVWPKSRWIRIAEASLRLPMELASACRRPFAGKSDNGTQMGRIQSELNRQ